MWRTTPLPRPSSERNKKLKLMIDPRLCAHPTEIGEEVAARRSTRQYGDRRRPPTVHPNGCRGQITKIYFHMKYIKTTYYTKAIDHKF